MRSEFRKAAAVVAMLLWAATSAAQQAPPDTPPAPQPAGQPTDQNAPATSSKVFNPDISVIGNFVGLAGKNPANDQPSLQLTEAEVAFQAIVDPYARADFFLAASPEGLEVEEGYITFTALPGNMLLKVGKMRAQFGKVNTFHTHRMPTVDRPLVTENLVGGEEGLSDSGMSLSHLIQNPVLFLEATGEIYASSSELFEANRKARVTYVARLRGYRDITESTNIDVGTSYAFGPNDVFFAFDDPVAPTTDLEHNRQLVGFDATFRYRPLRMAIYRRLNLSTELVWSRQDLPDGGTASAFGAYALGEYQFARRWYAGARYDQSARIFEADSVDHGSSVFVTFWPTEFSQIRTQYRWTKYAEGEHGNEFLFQFNFSIGAHGAHAF